MKNLLVMVVFFAMSSVAYAHPGHVHEPGLIAQLAHAIATNYLWLSVMALVGVIIGFRAAIKSMNCQICNDGKDDAT